MCALEDRLSSQIDPNCQLYRMTTRDATSHVVARPTRGHCVLKWVLRRRPTCIGKHNSIAEVKFKVISYHILGVFNYPSQPHAICLVKRFCIYQY